ncbi:hypothetical protein P3W24_06730 [Luteibacter sp. PPL201]|uniref:Ankyrin repeat domain-containing protein n=1 Tax=Luteibacter sahnii TaxID=3021977 RepID=A0ABT6B995_9GAMM
MHGQPANPLQQTTSEGAANDMTRLLEHAVLNRDVRRIRNQLALDGDPNLECGIDETYDGEDLYGLTVTSLAALVDSSRDGLLTLPLLLSSRADIGQVDSRGRTLLHFARSRPVARYLVENGVPLPDGMRQPLLDALSRPPGKVLFDDDVELAYRDGNGVEPPFLRSLRRSSHESFPLPEPPILPQPVWQTALSEDQFHRLLETGYLTPDHERAPTDFLYRPGRPPLTAQFSPAVEIELALLDRDAGRVTSCVEHGALDGIGRFRHVWHGDHAGEVMFEQLTAAGLATLIDSEAGKPEMVKLCVTDATLNDAHDAGGASLLHLARDPEVARWLLETGVCTSLTDDRGATAEESLPPGARAVVTHWRLTRAVPAAQNPSRSSGAGIARL